MKTQCKRVLVIKLRHLGDTLLSSPVFSNLQNAFPDAMIDAYIWKEAHPMLAGHPAIAHFHLHDRTWKKLPWHKRYIHELKLLKQIRKEKYDLVINLTEGDRGAISAKISGAKQKVGVDPGKKWTRKIYTDLVKPCKTNRHNVERDLDALRKMGIFPGEEERDLLLFIPKEAKERARELMGDEPFVVMQAAARWKFKCPPARVMAKVCDLLPYRVVLTGAPRERDYVEKIAELSKSEVLNLAGKTNLKEMAALLEKSKGLITVDSVALHMASALKVPVVALFGPTSEENWGPWMHPQSKVVAKNYPCRPCRMDGCGGSKVSDCLLTLSPERIYEAFVGVTSAAIGAASASSLFVLNSLETKRTE